MMNIQRNNIVTISSCLSFNQNLEPLNLYPNNRKNKFFGVMAIRISHILEAKHKGVPGLPGMRSVYWDHIKEAQARLSESDSSLSKTRVLELAREEWGPKVLNRFKVQNPLIIDPVSHVSH